MTYLLHGENSLASRSRLRELNVVEINPDEPLPQENSLFSKARAFAIWKDKKLSVAQVKELEKKFPQLKVEEFKLPPVVFQFVDALKPKNQKVFLPLWQQYLRQEIPEIAFSMVIRQFRLMLNPQSSDLAGWQKTKINSQAAAFGQEKLLLLYKKLLATDYEIKSGTSATDLATSLELILLTL